MPLVPIASPAVSVFKKIVQRNPEICNNCFRRWRRLYDRNYVVESDGYVRPVRDTVRDINSPSVYSVDDTTEDFQHEECGGKTFVCECGHLSGTTRPVSVDTGIEMAHRLASLLDDEGIAFDQDVLFDHVRTELTQPENQGRQDSVFDDAVTAAVEASDSTGCGSNDTTEDAGDGDGDQRGT